MLEEKKRYDYYWIRFGSASSQDFLVWDICTSLCENTVRTIRLCVYTVVGVSNVDDDA